MTVEELQKKYFILTDEEQLVMAKVFEISTRMRTDDTVFWGPTTQPERFFYDFVMSMRGGMWAGGQRYLIGMLPGLNKVITNFDFLYGYYALGGYIAADQNRVEHLRMTNELTARTPVLFILLAFYWYTYGATDFVLDPAYPDRTDLYETGPLGWRPVPLTLLRGFGQVLEQTYEPEYTLTAIGPPDFTLEEVLYLMKNALPIAAKIRAINLYGAEMITTMNTFEGASQLQLVTAQNDSAAMIAQAEREAVLIKREAALQSTEYEVDFAFQKEQSDYQMAMLTLQLEESLREI